MSGTPGITSRTVRVLTPCAMYRNVCFFPLHKMSLLTPPGPEFLQQAFSGCRIRFRINGHSVR